MGADLVLNMLKTYFVNLVTCVLSMVDNVLPPYHLYPFLLTLQVITAITTNAV